MELKDVNTWEDYEAYVSQTPEGKAIMDKCQRVADDIVTASDSIKEIGMQLVWFDENELPDWDKVDKLIYHYEDSNDEEERISAAS